MFSCKCFSNGLLGFPRKDSPCTNKFHASLQMSHRLEIMSLNKSYVKSLALVAVAALVSAGLVGLQAAPASAGERAIPRFYWAEPQMISSDLSMVTLGVLPDPTYGAKTATSDGFIVKISNYDPNYSWTSTATNNGVATISNTGWVTVVGLNPNTISTATITSTLAEMGGVGIVRIGRSEVTGTSLGAALAATFGTVTPTSDGFIFSIANYDASFSWAGSATNGGSVAISNTGLVTVTRVVPNTSSTITVVSSKPKYVSGSATITATALRSVLTPTFSPDVTPTPDGFIFIISNVDASFIWAGTATNGGSVAISNTGLVTVTGVAPNTSSTVTVTSTKTGFAMGRATIIATALQPGGAASFGTVNPTSDGFIFSIANYDASFSWAGSATNGGSVAISNTGLVTVTGLALNTSSTVTITSFKAGLAARTATITATAAQGIEKRLTVGTFKGYVAIYQKGYQGQTMTAKVAGKWMKVDSIASDFERTVRYTGAGYRIFIHLYIDGALVKIIQTITE